MMPKLSVVTYPLHYLVVEYPRQQYQQWPSLCEGDNIQSAVSIAENETSKSEHLTVVSTIPNSIDVFKPNILVCEGEETFESKPPAPAAARRHTSVSEGEETKTNATVSKTNEGAHMTAKSATSSIQIYESKPCLVCEGEETNTTVSNINERAQAASRPATSSSKCFNISAPQSIIMHHQQQNNSRRQRYQLRWQMILAVFITIAYSSLSSEIWRRIISAMPIKTMANYWQRHHTSSGKTTPVHISSNRYNISLHPSRQAPSMHMQHQKCNHMVAHRQSTPALDITHS